MFVQYFIYYHSQYYNMLIFENNNDYYDYTDIAPKWDWESKRYSKCKRPNTPTVVVVNSEAIFSFDRDSIDVHLIYPKDDYKKDELLGSFNKLKNALLFAELYEHVMLL